MALHTAQWHCVAASYDAATGAVCLYQELQSNWPVAHARAEVCKTISPLTVGENGEDLLMAAASGPEATHHFNGKIDNPRLYDRALSVAEADADTPDCQLGLFPRYWAREIVRDTEANQLHGRTVNLPTRAGTGHNWTGDESDFKVAPNQYGAIHFHDDDLEDAEWDAAFEWTVPPDWPSGVYAAHLASADAEDYLPIIVVPAKPQARIAFLAPTLT